MKIKVIVGLLISHLLIGGAGFVLGIYALPILIAPDAPSESDISNMITQQEYSAVFKKDLKDSDNFHWGEGEVSISSEYIALKGELAPGPDYKLYLSPEFVETEADFNRIKSSMFRVGDVKTFDNFLVEVPQGTDLSKYNTVVVWCETFGEFITSAKYR